MDQTPLLNFLPPEQRTRLLSQLQQTQNQGQQPPSSGSNEDGQSQPSPQQLHRFLKRAGGMGAMPPPQFGSGVSKASTGSNSNGNTNTALGTNANANTGGTALIAIATVVGVVAVLTLAFAVFVLRRRMSASDDGEGSIQAGTAPVQKSAPSAQQQQQSQVQPQQKQPETPVMKRKAASDPVDPAAVVLGATNNNLSNSGSGSAHSSQTHMASSPSSGAVAAGARTPRGSRKLLRAWTNENVVDPNQQLSGQGGEKPATPVLPNRRLKYAEIEIANLRRSGSSASLGSRGGLDGGLQRSQSLRSIKLGERLTANT